MNWEKRLVEEVVTGNFSGNTQFKDNNVVSLVDFSIDIWQSDAAPYVVLDHQLYQLENTGRIYAIHPQQCTNLYYFVQI